MVLTHDEAKRISELIADLDRAYADHENAMRDGDIPAGLKAAEEIMVLDGSFMYPITTYNDFH
jgi:hypothetical protein